MSKTTRPDLDLEANERSEEFSSEEESEAQLQLMVYMGVEDDEQALKWVEAYSKDFRILINGYDGPYMPENDTKEAHINRSRFRKDREGFYTSMKEQLIKEQPVVLH